MKNLIFLLLIITAVIMGCGNSPPQPATFGQPVKVTINGYSGNMMEPFISRDDRYLLFNNLNAAPENTNLHYAQKISETEFEYKGEIGGVNTADLEGTPTMDNANNLFFISARSYLSTLSTIYRGEFSSGLTSGVDLVTGIPASSAGTLIFDVEVDADGSTLYFAEGIFDSGNPQTADIVIAKKAGLSFARLSNGAEIMKNVNSAQLEYAASISSDGLELFFTRVETPITSTSTPQIYVSTRSGVNDSFGIPVKLTALAGFVEAGSVSADGKRLYFHKKDGDKFQIYLSKR